MAFTSSRPVSVDGVRLDTLAWNIEKVERSTAERRNGDYDASGMDGTIPSTWDTLEAASYGLSMWLRGTDVDGAVPGVGSQTTLRQNLDELLHLFGTRHRLLDLREVVDAGGTERRAWAKVVVPLSPELTTGTAATFNVAMVLPYGVWEDVATADQTLTAPAGAEVTILQGATAHINDGIFVVTNPAGQAALASPRLTDPATGQWVELGISLAAGQTWRFNSATWASRYGTGLTVASADTAGTDGTAVTNVGGPPAAYGLPLVPVRTTADKVRRVKLTLTASSGMGAVQTVTIRARRKYAA